MKVKNKFRQATCALLTAALFSMCANAQRANAAAPVKATYQPSEADFPNPERGFYADSYFNTEDEPAPLDAAALVLQKEAEGYQVSIIHRSYYIPGYRDAQTLPPEFLALVSGDLASAREAGVKLILRFAYRPDENREGNPVYRDPSRATILRHLEDLEPVLRANEDVLVYLDAGLIGAWGEWHSATPNNRDSVASNDPDGPLMDELAGSPDPVGEGPGGDPQDPAYNLQNYDRKLPNALTLEIVEKFLEVVPETRSIAIRYPLAKAALLEGEALTELTEPLTDETAHQNTLRARLGAVNDCFLASVDDFGTYYYGGIPELDTPEEVAEQIVREKNYLSQDNLYVPMGGETCAEEPYTAPAFGSFPEYAEKEFEQMRWTTLNTDYNQGTLDALGDYLAVAKRRLGYRLELVSSSLPGAAEAGSDVTLTLTLTNSGYASPINPRNLEVVFRGEDDTLTTRPVETKREDGTDPRFWQPGRTQTVSVTVAAPEVAGDFEVLVNLPDPMLPNVVTSTLAEATLARNYAIRLANEGVWEADTGLNKLDHTLTVR